MSVVDRIRSLIEPALAPLVVDEVKDLVRARLRSSRVPERVLIVDELPYNEMGKLLRREVKKTLAT